MGSRAQRLEVHLLPWVLVPPNDDAWVVSIYEKQGLFWIFVSEEPVKEAGSLYIPLYDDCLHTSPRMLD